MSASRGFTLIELMVSMTIVAILMAAMVSAVLITTRSIDDGTSAAARTVTSRSVTSQITRDLHFALDFSERTDKAVTFTVPDRDGDLAPETVRYAWSGVVGDPLTKEYNGGPAVVIAEDVQDLKLSYLLRAESAPLPTGACCLPDDTCVTDSSSGCVAAGGTYQGDSTLCGGLVCGGPDIFGFDTAFATPVSGVRWIQLATQVTLPEDGTVESITAYVYDTFDVRYAVYDDAGGVPGNLVVETATAQPPASGPDWFTLSVTPTALTAGTYWLALAFRHDAQRYYQEAGGETRYKNNDAVTNGYLSSWGVSDDSFTIKVSIYATYTPD